MSAELRRNGGPDTGHVGAVCHAESCQDGNGRPWQVWHSRRTTEGQTLAKRDRDEHNRTRHPAHIIDAMTEVCEVHGRQCGRELEDAWLDQEPYEQPTYKVEQPDRVPDRIRRPLADEQDTPA